MVKYNENDEIELTLEHNVSYHYFLKWRYKNPRKFLFFNIKDKWKYIHYYTPGIFTVDMDPNDDLYWYWRGFHLDKKSDVQEYEKIKSSIKTKKQLFDYYHVKDNVDLYSRHLHEHNAWVNETNKTVKRLTKDEK